jgi:pimeloyl-ACP methyl ester carboxylesterase
MLARGTLGVLVVLLLVTAGALHVQRTSSSSAGAIVEAKKQVVRLTDNTRLPFDIIGTEGGLRLIVSHGLGQSKEQDTAVDLARAVFASQGPPLGFRALSYTARGHGTSTGWEHCPLAKFHWRDLAGDMLAVARAHDMERFIVMGCSMGAATALYAALQEPNRIEAVVLVRPPTAWETRKQRKAGMVNTAAKAKAKGRTLWARVLEGAAEADLPPKESAAYAALSGIPVLLLCHGDDDVHPVSTGTQLMELLPPHAMSKLVVAADLAEGERTWPRILSDWLWHLRRGNED